MQCFAFNHLEIVEQMGEKQEWSIYTPHVDTSAHERCDGRIEVVPETHVYPRDVCLGIFPERPLR